MSDDVIVLGCSSIDVDDAEGIPIMSDDTDAIRMPFTTNIANNASVTICLRRWFNMYHPNAIRVFLRTDYEVYCKRCAPAFRAVKTVSDE